MSANCRRNHGSILRELVNRLERPAAIERLEHRPHPPVRAAPRAACAAPSSSNSSSCRDRREQPPGPSELQRPDALQERFLERAPDGHRLADRLHLRRQRRIRFGELLEVPARDLHDDVVDRRLEGGRREARDVVGDLVEVIAERELRGDLRDREARGLRRQRGRPRHARVHLDDDHAAVGRVHGELDVRCRRSRRRPGG